MDKNSLLKALLTFQQAMFNCDKEALQEIIADEYRGISIAGQFEDKQLIVDAYGSDDIKLEKYELKNKKVDVFQETGIISGEGFISGSYQDQHFEHKVLFTDIYVLRDKQWKLFHSHSTEIMDLEK